MVIIPAMFLSGCLGVSDGNGDDGPASFIQVTIEFEEFSPTSYPGMVAIWTPDREGGWEMRTEDSGGEDTVYVVFELKATDVLDALDSAGEAGNFEVDSHRESMGAFVDSIDGVINGEDGHWWSYYLNGEYGTVAADNAALEDGDKVRWVYMSNPFG
jgi:hypothetical protein